MIADMLRNKKNMTNSNRIIYKEQENKNLLCFYYTV